MALPLKSRFRGLSIVEILMATAIAAVMLASLTYTMRAVAMHSRANTVFEQAARSARVLTDYMTTSIRQAKSCGILELAAEAPAGVTLGANEVPVTKLILEIPDPQPDNAAQTRILMLAVSTTAGRSSLTFSPMADFTQSSTIDIGDVAVICEYLDPVRYAMWVETEDFAPKMENGHVLAKNVRIIMNVKRSDGVDHFNIPVSTQVGIRRAIPPA